MAGKGTLTIRIAGDSAPLKSELDKVDGQLKGFGSKIGSFGKGAAAGFAAAFATDKLLAFGGDLLGVGNKVAVWRQKTKTVFESSAGDVKKWADKNNEAFGMTDDELAGVAASFGDLLKPMGFTAAQAATMATDVVGLSGALSAWSGGQKNAAEVSDILSKAMLGERDGLKALGISISEADVQAQLAKNGTEALTGAALEQAKAVATQELIFAKSTDAQKAWADGSMDAQKNQNELKASIAEVKEKIATALMPAFNAVTKFATDTLIPGVKKIVDVFGKDGLGGVINLVKDKFKELWPAVKEKLGELLTGAIDWVKENVPKIAAQLLEWGKTFVGWVAPQIPPLLVELGKLLLKLAEWVGTVALPAIVKKLGDLAKAFVDWVPGATWTLVQKLGEMAASLLGWIGELPGKIAGKAVGMFDGFKDAFKSAINWLIRAWNKLEFKIPGFDPPGPGPKFPGFTLGVPNIPEFHQGGIFKAPTPGGEGLALLQDGERVLSRAMSRVTGERGREITTVGARVRFA